jgi:hypothetical protein
MTITKFPNRRRAVQLEQLASLMQSLRDDPATAIQVSYAEMLVALGEAFEAAERYATEHKLTPSPLDYIKENFDAT